MNPPGGLVRDQTERMTLTTASLVLLAVGATMLVGLGVAQAAGRLPWGGVPAGSPTARRMGLLSIALGVLLALSQLTRLDGALAVVGLVAAVGSAVVGIVVAVLSLRHFRAARRAG